MEKRNRKAYPLSIKLTHVGRVHKNVLKTIKRDTQWRFPIGPEFMNENERSEDRLSFTYCTSWFRCSARTKHWSIQGRKSSSANLRTNDHLSYWSWRKPMTNHVINSKSISNWPKTIFEYSDCDCTVRLFMSDQLIESRKSHYFQNSDSWKMPDYACE